MHDDDDDDDARKEEEEIEGRETKHSSRVGEKNKIKNRIGPCWF